jgi:soluble lytic murein transglycosylase-like protein
MLRIPHYLDCLILTAGAALLAQPVLASERQHRAHAAAAYRAAAIKREVATSPSYDAFGGYADAAAAAHYAGPNGRHYFNAAPSDRRAEFASMVEAQASANGVPASLVHRVIMRESRYNPRAVSAGNYGLMQIRLGTARAMGYSGSAEGLLDAEINMTYAVKYLAGAYQAAGGNEARAVALYASGYGARPVRQASSETSAFSPTGYGGASYSGSPPAAALHAGVRVKHMRHHQA